MCSIFSRDTHTKFKPAFEARHIYAKSAVSYITSSEDNAPEHRIGNQCEGARIVNEERRRDYGNSSGRFADSALLFTVLANTLTVLTTAKKVFTKKSMVGKRLGERIRKISFE